MNQTAAFDTSETSKRRPFFFSYELLLIIISAFLAYLLRIASGRPLNTEGNTVIVFLIVEILTFCIINWVREKIFGFCVLRAKQILLYSAAEEALLVLVPYALFVFLVPKQWFSRLLVLLIYAVSLSFLALFRLFVLKQMPLTKRGEKSIAVRFLRAGEVLDESGGSPVLSPDTCLRMATAFICVVLTCIASERPLFLLEFTNRMKQQWPFYAVITVVVLFLMVLLLWSLSGSYLFGVLFGCSVWNLIALVNAYGIRYHGTVLTIEDVSNIKTAQAVLGGYSLRPDKSALDIILLWAFCIILPILTTRICRKKYVDREHKFRERPVRGLSALLLLFLIFGGARPLVVLKVNAWDWSRLYCEHGLVIGMVESTAANLGDIVNIPPAYQDDKIDEISFPETSSKTAMAADNPDIILILNESWYDPVVCREDLETDTPYNAFYRSLDAVKGVAVVPRVGGGTNGSEYELLTSNSVQLISAYAPFNRMSLLGAHSVVSYLEELGYTSMAAHPHREFNYHRSISWDQLGIDELHFIDDFSDVTYYGTRNKGSRVTDQSAMENFVRFYEAMPEDRPRLGYLLTMQNHGGWEDNAAAEDLVHVTAGNISEEQKEQMNEYLSCMKLTDDALAYITDYFTKEYQKTGRKVVLCMVGDHAPSFMKDMSDQNRSAAMEDICLRSVPYLIWCNYKGEEIANQETGIIDLNVLTPMVLTAAGMPLTPYQQYMLDLNCEVLTYTNVSSGGDWAYMTRAGEIFSAEEADELSRRVMNYYYLEYNNIGSKAERSSKWFMLTG